MYSCPQFTLPAGTTKKLKIIAAWDFAFMIVPVGGSSAPSFGVWYFIAGYATGSRARVSSISDGQSYFLAVETAPDYTTDKTFNLRNAGDGAMSIRIIPFINDNRFELI